MGKRESPKSERGTGFFDPGVFILDHLQTVKLILFQKIPLFLPFILGGLIPYYPRERKRGSSMGR